MESAQEKDNRDPCESDIEPPVSITHTVRLIDLAFPEMNPKIYI